MPVGSFSSSSTVAFSGMTQTQNADGSTTLSSPTPQSGTPYPGQVTPSNKAAVEALIASMQSSDGGGDSGGGSSGGGSGPSPS